MPLAATAAHARASAFWAVVCVPGAAFWPELSPPLYGSVIFTHGRLQLRSPIRALAGGSGDDVGLGWGHFHHRIAPICAAVSVHVR